jgi:hypothetical protein
VIRGGLSFAIVEVGIMPRRQPKENRLLESTSVVVANQVLVVAAEYPVRGLVEVHNLVVLVVDNR